MVVELPSRPPARPARAAPQDGPKTAPQGRACSTTTAGPRTPTGSGLVSAPPPAADAAPRGAFIRSETTGASAARAGFRQIRPDRQNPNLLWSNCLTPRHVVSRRSPSRTNNFARSRHPADPDTLRRPKRCRSWEPEITDREGHPRRSDPFAPEGRAARCAPVAARRPCARATRRQSPISCHRGIPLPRRRPKQTSVRRVRRDKHHKRGSSLSLLLPNPRVLRDAPLPALLANTGRTRKGPARVQLQRGFGALAPHRDAPRRRNTSSNSTP